MLNTDILKKSGIDYESGLARFMDDSRLYETILITFIDDDTFKLAETAFENGDYPQLFKCVHTLKGLSGNLDMTRLYKLTCELTELLRANDNPDTEKVKALFAEAQTAYAEICDGIAAAQQL